MIHSIRPQFEAYRYYEEEAVDRVREICVLRKMQISIKDIQKIYASQDIRVVVATFVKNINEIDLKITTLSELRSLMNEFLNRMVESGVYHISALPYLYEKFSDENPAEEVSNKEEIYDERNGIIKYNLNQIVEFNEPMLELVELPYMLVWTSIRKDTMQSDVEGFYEWLEEQSLLPFVRKVHTIFEYQDESGVPIILCVKPFEVGNCPFTEEDFIGGFFVSGSVYAEDDIEHYYNHMVKKIDENPYYQVDYRSEGKLKYRVLAESTLVLDRQREKVNLLIPVKRRIPDVGKFEPCKVVEEISMDEILENERVLWIKSVSMDKLTKVNEPYYALSDSGEAVYIPYISIRRLSTNEQVRFPFRMDIDFRIEKGDTSFAYNASEGSIIFYYGNYHFGINMENVSEPALSKQAITFEQPVFKDRYVIPKKGWINENDYNHVTWIIGNTYLAVIINNEVRYCAKNMPYMKTDLHEEPINTVVIGGNGQGKIHIKKIEVTQLKNRRKTLLKGDFAMNMGRSNNKLDILHQLIWMERGQNYWFNGCASYIMELKGETQFDYDFFAGISGDIFAQIYTYDYFRGDSATDYRISNGDGSFIEEVLSKCGYASTFVRGEQLEANTEMYLQTLIRYIDQGMPVIYYRPVWGLIVGYEDYGQVLLVLTEDKCELERISLRDAITRNEGIPCNGWVFIGEKKEDKELVQIYRDSIFELKNLLNTNNGQYCFGATAFRKWAEEIESDKFVKMKPDEFDDWTMYKVYVCNLATNSTCGRNFLLKALELNPDLVFIHDIMEEYKKTEQFWYQLEGLLGGFNVSLEVLQNKEKAIAIAEKIREFAECMDKVVELIK